MTSKQPHLERVISVNKSCDQLADNYVLHVVTESISPGPKLFVRTFRNKTRFYGENLLAPRSNPS